MKNRFSFLVLILFLSIFTYAQEDVQIGKSLRSFTQYDKGAQYDYSDPDAINIKVLVWGYVEFPGQYIIPSTSSVNDLLALAGGPLPDANIDDLRLFKTYKDSSQVMVKFNYDDLLWNDNLTKDLYVPKLNAGDILLVPGAPRWFVKDYLAIALAIVSTLSSVAVLIITILE